MFDPQFNGIRGTIRTGVPGITKAGAARGQVTVAWASLLANL